MFSRKPCLTCNAKDDHINALNNQIEMLRALVFPKTGEIETSFTAREADAILNGSYEPIQLTDEELDKEAQLILSGNYDNAQVDNE